MVAVEIPGSSAAESLRKHSNELQHLIQDKSIEVESEQQAAQVLSENGNDRQARKHRNREVPSRYKAATISSAAAAAATAQRSHLVAPSMKRCPSLNLGPNSTAPHEASASKRALSAERRPLSVERRRPWPSTAAPPAETKTSRSLLDAVKSVAKRLPGRSSDSGLWPSKNTLSSSIQSDTPSSASSAGLLDGKSREEGIATSYSLNPSSHGVRKSSESASVAQQLNAPERKGAQERKGTPEMRRTPSRRQSADQLENAKPFENLNLKPELPRWPGIGNGRASGLGMSKSMDLTLERQDSLRRVASLSVPSRYAIAYSKSAKSGSPGRIMSRSVNESPMVSVSSTVARRILFDARDGEVSRGKEGSPRHEGMQVGNGRIEDARSHLREAGDQIYDSNLSDTESSSSGSSGAVQNSSGGASRAPGRGTAVPAGFWKDMASRLRREGARIRSSISDSGEGKGSRRSRPSSPSIGTLPGPSTNGSSSPSPISTWALSPGRATYQSGLSTPQTPSSPSAQLKHPFQISSPSRGWASPTRTRGVQQPLLPPTLSLNGRPNSLAGAWSFGFDARKGKRGPNQQEEAHDLRILHNRWLQWRFVNARAEAAMNAQKVAAENLLYNVWAKTSDLCMSVAVKQAELQKARQALKLGSILSSHNTHLESWESLQQEHSTALTGVIKALEAAIIKVPVIGGAKIDVQALKEALSSATYIVNAMEPSVSKILPKAEVRDSLLSELAKTVVQERAFLEECGDLLVATAALEVEEHSLRSHLIQMDREKGQNVTTSRDDQ